MALPSLPRLVDELLTSEPRLVDSGCTLPGRDELDDELPSDDLPCFSLYDVFFLDPEPDEWSEDDDEDDVSVAFPRAEAGAAVAAVTFAATDASGCVVLAATSTVADESPSEPVGAEAGASVSVAFASTSPILTSSAADAAVWATAASAGASVGAAEAAAVAAALPAAPASPLPLPPMLTEMPTDVATLVGDTSGTVASVVAGASVDTGASVAAGTSIATAAFVAAGASDAVGASVTGAVGSAAPPALSPAVEGVEVAGESDTSTLTVVSPLMIDGISVSSDAIPLLLLLLLLLSLASFPAEVGVGV